MATQPPAASCSRQGKRRRRRAGAHRGGGHERIDRRRRRFRDRRRSAPGGRLGRPRLSLFRIEGRVDRRPDYGFPRPPPHPCRSFGRQIAALAGSGKDEAQGQHRFSLCRPVHASDDGQAQQQRGGDRDRYRTARREDRAGRSQYRERPEAGSHLGEDRSGRRRRCDHWRHQPGGRLRAVVAETAQRRGADGAAVDLHLRRRLAHAAGGHRRKASRLGAKALMRHQHRQLGVLHDVAGGAAEDHLPQAVPGKGALDQEIAALRRGGPEHGFAGAAAV